MGDRQTQDFHRPRRFISRHWKYDGQPQTIECLLEKSELKIGLYAPGTHIPVQSEALLYSQPPDLALLLSWNLADELISKLRKNGFQGEFIVTFPKVTII